MTICWTTATTTNPLLFTTNPVRRSPVPGVFYLEFQMPSLTRPRFLKRLLAAVSTDPNIPPLLGLPLPVSVHGSSLERPRLSDFGSTRWQISVALRSAPTSRIKIAAFVAESSMGFLASGASGGLILTPILDPEDPTSADSGLRFFVSSKNLPPSRANLKHLAATLRASGYTVIPPKK